MAQSVKCLPCKHEDLGSRPTTLVKGISMTLRFLLPSQPDRSRPGPMSIILAQSGHPYLLYNQPLGFFQDLLILYTDPSHATCNLSTQPDLPLHYRLEPIQHTSPVPFIYLILPKSFLTLSPNLPKYPHFCFYLLNPYQTQNQQKKVHMPKYHHKKTNNMKDQGSSSSPKPTSPVGMFANENYLDDPQDTELFVLSL